MKKVLYLSTVIAVLSSFTAQGQTRMACLLGDTLSINLNNSRGDIQWQSSIDSLEWTDIAGQNASTLDFLPSSGNQWVRAVIQEEDCPEFIDQAIRVSALDTTLPGIDPNVVVMDTVIVEFMPDSLQQLQGIYQFNCDTTESPLQPGDLIIGTEGEGYLRFIDAYVLQNGTLVTYTHQATLDDLFDDAAFSFDFSADSLEPRSVGFNYDIEQTVLYNQGPVSLTLTSGNVNMTGDWAGDMEYSLFGGLESFNFGTENTVLQSTFNFNLTVEQAIDLIEGSKKLAKFSKDKLVIVAGAPVVVSLTSELIAKYKLTLNASAQMDATLTSSLDVQTEFIYENGEWGGILEAENLSEIVFTLPSGQIAATLELALVPETKLKLYGVIGPYVNPETKLDITGAVALPELNWDVSAEAFGEVKAGIEVGIDPGDNQALVNIFGQPETYEAGPYLTPKLTVYKTPYQIELVSGDNQSGEPGEMLADSIIIVVKDTFGISQSNVPVEILVSSGGGSVSESNLLSDDNGRVGITWTLGEDLQVDQELSFIVKNGSNEQVEGSPLIVTTSSGGCGDSTSVTDIDGNEYPIIQIGDQCWTAENLKTTRFADGSVIPNVTSGDSWINLSTPAWCNYENSPANDITYGKLYNWFTVADPRNVCPTGWHVPTDAEWTVLTDYLGGQDVAGGKMKTTTVWQSPNTGATNESGFSGLPGGTRTNYGVDFTSIGGYGYWWSSSESSTTFAWYRYLTYTNVIAVRNVNYKQYGFSVRCVQG